MSDKTHYADDETLAYITKLEAEITELRKQLEVTTKYLEDDLWVSGESRQLQRESAKAVLAKESCLKQIDAAMDKTETHASGQVLVPVDTLERWRVCLSQGDYLPRWEIEKILRAAGGRHG